jgi:hypothetical protein
VNRSYVDGANYPFNDLIWGTQPAGYSSPKGFREENWCDLYVCPRQPYLRSTFVRKRFHGTIPKVGTLCFSWPMAEPIEDYALLSDLATGPLVAEMGSIDWLCFPRFDSPSVFSALLGGPEHGRWVIAPEDDSAEVVAWHYVKSTFILETTWQTPQGRVRVMDFMPVGRQGSTLLRRVVGLEGDVRFRQELSIRPDYGQSSRG